MPNDRPAPKRRERRPATPPAPPMPETDRDKPRPGRKPKVEQLLDEANDLGGQTYGDLA